MVRGGVVLGGGRGWVVAAVAGAFVLEALFLLLNIAGVPSTLRNSVQGVIIIAAVAYAGVSFRARRARPRAAASPQASPDPGKEPEPPVAPAQSDSHVLRGEGSNANQGG